MDKEKVIRALNDMLSQEHACSIRYATHAATVTGPYAEAISARLAEISGDEVLHAQKLRDRILALGGVPTMDVATEDLVHAEVLEEILDINIKEEYSAIAGYKKILSDVPMDNVILFQTLQEIIRDEQEHLEELENLLVED